MTSAGGVVAAASFFFFMYSAAPLIAMNAKTTRTINKATGFFTT